MEAIHDQLPQDGQNQTNLGFHSEHGHSPPPANPLHLPQHRRHHNHHREARILLRRSHMYFLFSLFVAVIAIVSPSGRILHPSKMTKENGSTPMGLHWKDAHWNSGRNVDTEMLHKSSHGNSLLDVKRRPSTLKCQEEEDEGGGGGSESGGGGVRGLDDTCSSMKMNTSRSEDDWFSHIFGKKDGKSLQKQQQQQQQHVHPHSEIPHWLQWILRNQSQENKQPKTSTIMTKSMPSSFMRRFVQKLVDPAILNWIEIKRKGGNPRKEQYAIADKILTSTPRLISIVNFILAFTYLMHFLVADFFLGDTFGNHHPLQGSGLDHEPTTVLGIGASNTDMMHRSSRERLGGYLLFKLLLVTAVVEPDTLDLLILLTWFTLLAFMRSLSFQAGITITQTAASGLPPHSGVFVLLLALFVSNGCAALLCTTLFHQAGWSMVLLLTCDSILLFLDILTHLTRFGYQVLDTKYQLEMSSIEDKKIQIYDILQTNFSSIHEQNNEDDINITLRQMDGQMEQLDVKSKRREVRLMNMVFVFDIVSLLVTIFHFIHVWVLNGITFNLVDGILAIHLHSAISTMARKIKELRNHHRIAREINLAFPDVSDIDLQKSLSSGDVCSICLGMLTIGHVKKVGCGHLFHIHCLREVAERARSIEATRCPLCRASLLDGSRQDFNQDQLNLSNRSTLENPNGPTNIHQNIGRPIQNERSVFRISTEGLLPSWIPLPAFSFEVVHRTDIDTPIDRNEQAANLVQEPIHQSIWRRILTLTGVLPMTPEEESNALNALVEMFPQLDRNDLLHELRNRGSPEAVAESVLSGVLERH